MRAFLSGEYVAYNNSEIAETVEGLLKNGEISSSSSSWKRPICTLKIVSDEIVDKAAGLKAGVVIGNSEVGAGSVSGDPFVYRAPCTNDLIVGIEKSFRHVHIHLTPTSLRAGLPRR